MPAAEGEPLPLYKFPCKRDKDFRLVRLAVLCDKFAVQLRFIVIAEQGMLRDAVLSVKLQPYALPDARIWHIIAIEWFARPALFAPRHGIIQRIFAPHDDYIVALFEKLRYIRRKGRKPARMREDMHAV